MAPRELLQSGAQKLGMSLTIDQIAAILVYLSELEKWNRKINLTAIRDERDIIIKHVLDSLTYLRGFTPCEGVRLLDMGSGAGFPALPLKIVHPELTVTMVESVKKKASFLRHIVRTLKMSGIDVIDRRTNELSDAYQSSFDVVTARAFADMEAAIEMGTPFLRQGGRIVLSRGPEEGIADAALVQRGVHLESKIGLTLPYSDYQRALWIFVKR